MNDPYDSILGYCNDVFNSFNANAQFLYLLETSDSLRFFLEPQVLKTFRNGLVRDPPPPQLKKTRAWNEGEDWFCFSLTNKGSHYAEI